MKIQPKIESITVKNLVGIQMQMNFSKYQVGLLWSKFMPQSTEIKNRVTRDLISLAVYPEGFSFSKAEFNPELNFTKWAGAEVENLNHIPQGMEPLRVPAGLYAVFHYKGLNTDTSIFEYIHGEWLPNSPYGLDHRPHFEVLGDRYKNGDPNSEEDIFIPIRFRDA